MVKREVFAAAMLGIMITGGTALAEGGSQQTATAEGDFSYYVSGRDVVISYDGEMDMGYNDDTSVIIGVYDNDVLVNTTITGVSANTPVYSPGTITVHLADDTENTSVKMFVWTDDGKLTPKTGARTAAKAGTVSFKTASVIDDDPEIGTDYAGNKKIPVYESGSTDAVKYSLADNANIYVNDFWVGELTNQYIKDYILYNENGAVTLVDFNNDNMYDLVCVEYYVTAVVDSMQDTVDFKRIYFKISDTNSSMKWSNDSDITFVKNGIEISYEDINENDVLSIKYDIANGNSLIDSDFYYVIVSSDTVTGVVTSKDEYNNTINIDGFNYEMGSHYFAEDMEVLSNYTLYLDAFGKVAYFDEWETYKNYGIIVAMYQEADNNYPTVKLITDEGETMEYECKDMNEANSFYNFATDSFGGFKTDGFMEADIADRLMHGATVCTYSLTDGKISMDRTLCAVGGTALEFKSSSCKLGQYQINDRVTRIIDMEDYASGGSDRAYAAQVSDLSDECEYTVYLCDRNSNGIYRFAMVFGGLHSLRPTDSFAVVQRVIGEAKINGTDCIHLIIAKDGEENIDLYVENNEVSLGEGSVFVYTQGHNGYVECGDYCVIMTPDSSYATESKNTLEKEWFSDGLGGTTDIAVGNEQIKKIAYNGESSYSTEGLLYFGPVHIANDNFVEICTRQQTGLTNTYYNVADFNIEEDTVSYMYDYSRGEGCRVSVNALRNSTSGRFSGAYADDSIDWSAAAEKGIEPDYVLAKVINGKLRELVGFLAPEYTPSDEPDPEPYEEIRYGAVTSLYQNDNEEHEITLAADDGEIKRLTVSDTTLIETLIGMVDPDGVTDCNRDGVYSSSEVVSIVGIQNTVIKYTASLGVLETAEKLIPRGGDHMVYSEPAGKLGGCLVSDERTRFIDATDYVSGSGEKIYLLKQSMLDDGGEYTAYLYDKSDRADYRFVIMIDAQYVKADSTMAVVKSIGDTTDINGTVCTGLTVAQNEQENIRVFIEGDSTELEEGSVIAYMTGREGYVEQGQCYEIFRPASDSYSALLADTLSYPKFSDRLKNVTDTELVKYMDAKTPAYDTSVSKEVVLYYGIVYKKSGNSLELITSQENGISDISNTESFLTTNANSYVYDYGQNKKYRVCVDTLSQYESIFNGSYTDLDKNYISWNAAVENEAGPAMAVVKVVDGDVIDIIYYVAP